MPTLPGGQIIGGMGGRIYTGPMGFTANTFAGYSALSSIPDAEEDAGGAGYLEVDQWAIARQWINADCTHSGTYGAITRRLVAYDWQFQCSMPADQANLPDYLLNVQMSTAYSNPEFVNSSIAFFLGDVKINPEAVAMEMIQRFYFAPMCLIKSCQPVLNASRDVIRYQVSGEGNSRMFLIPDESDDCTTYCNYLLQRGWWA